MIVLWLATGVLAKPSGVEPPSAPSIGFVLFEGKTPDWIEKRRLIIEESERQAKRRETIKPVEAKDVSVVTDFSEDWANLGSMLKGYGAYLKPTMSALDKFLEAKSKREAQEALRKLQIQLEDEIVLIMAASV